jgi:hypothetical protein
MIVSETLQSLVDYYGRDIIASQFDRMYEVCLEQGFDLDDFLFEIWKDTFNDY